MTRTELESVARQLAESRTDIASSFGGALNGSPASIARIRHALMVARSAVDGTDLVPLVWEEESSPAEWGGWTDRMAFATNDLDDSDVLLLDPADQLAAV
jgi:hypothetical protein